MNSARFFLTALFLLPSPGHSLFAGSLEELSAEVQSLRKEVRDLKAEVKELQLKNLTSENSTQLTEALTQEYKPVSQKLLEGYGWRGKLLDYSIDFPFYEKGTLYFRQLFIWENEDATGGIAAIATGMSIESGKITEEKLIDKQAISKEDLASAKAGETNSKGSLVNASPTFELKESEKPGFYERNQKQIDQSAITVGTAAASAVVLKLIQSWSTGK